MNSPQEKQGSQEQFLNAVMRENIPVVVYLVNSIQLRGSVRGFDTFTLLLESPGRPISLVYKSAITSIVPVRLIRLYTREEATQTGNQSEGMAQRDREIER